MKPDKNTDDKNVKKETDVKKTVDDVETPVPPQHMDPSEKPEKEKALNKSNKPAKKTSTR